MQRNSTQYRGQHVVARGGTDAGNTWQENTGTLMQEADGSREVRSQRQYRCRRYLSVSSSCSPDLDSPSKAALMLSSYVSHFCDIPPKYQSAPSFT